MAGHVAPPAAHQTPARVGVRELRQNLPAYLRRVRAGATVLITSHDIVVAELRPAPTAMRPSRQPGAMRGEIWMADGFDTLPDDIIDAMEGRLE